jgi:phospholipid transport system substrate-binding protein
MTETDAVDELTRLVRETTESLFKAIEEKGLTPESDEGIVALVDEIVSPHVDYARASQWVLGKHWRRASPEQQRQFIEEFRRLLTRMYANSILEFSDVPIAYLRESENGNGDEAAVRTLIEPEGKAPIHIGYRLHNEHGAWKLFDIIVDGTSLVSTHRAVFSTEIEKSGIDGLIHSLAARNGGESS